MAPVLICFGCMEEVELKPAQMPSGQWVAACAKCGVTNKLRQDPDNTDTFSISGAFVTVEPELLRARLDASKDVFQWPDGSWCFRRDYLQRVVRRELHRIILHLSNEWERFFGLEENAEHKPRD